MPTSVHCSVSIGHVCALLVYISYAKDVTVDREEGGNQAMLPRELENYVIVWTKLTVDSTYVDMLTTFCISSVAN